MINEFFKMDWCTAGTDGTVRHWMMVFGWLSAAEVRG